MNVLAVLIDTDVLLDFLTERGIFTKNAKGIVQKVAEKKINAFLAAHSITNLFYILRKIYSVSERKQLLMALCQSITIVEIGSGLIFNVFTNSNFDDIEDCLQAECALSVNADYIITRNINDYTHSGVPAILPEELLKILKASEKK